MVFFSVIIPAYNVEKYIESCLKSVINQTMQDFEVVVVNDGSNDNSGTICEKYRELYPDKFVVIHQENKGLLITRRSGIARAKGEYFVFLDSDDKLRKDALEELKNVILEHKCDMVIFNASIVEDFATKFLQYPFENERIFEGEGKNELYRLLCTSSMLNSLCFKMVKRSIVDVDADYNSYREINNGEDLLQSLPLITNAKKIVLFNESLYYYRQNRESISYSFDLNAYKSAKLLKQIVHNYILLWGRKDEYEKSFFVEYLNDIYVLVASSLFIKKEQIPFLDKYFEEISEDEYFRKIYRDVQHSEIRKKRRFILWLIYIKKYKWIEWWIVLKYILKKH